MILASVILTFLFPRELIRRESIFKYFDAIGLGVFSAITASVTWNTPGINPLSVLYIATITGCAGGVVRDLIAEKRTLVLSNELYVTPVMLGAAALMTVQALGGSPTAAFVTAMVVATSIRLLAIRFDWRLPRILSIDVCRPAPAAEISRALEEVRK